MVLTRIWGLPGAGMAFLAVYIFYTLLMIAVMHKLIDSSWNRRSLQVILAAAVVMVVVQFNCWFNQHLPSAWAINLSILLVTSWVCLQQLLRSSGLTVQLLLEKFKGQAR